VSAEGLEYDLVKKSYLKDLAARSADLEKGPRASLRALRSYQLELLLNLSYDFLAFELLRSYRHRASDREFPFFLDPVLQSGHDSLITEAL
jgi:hypothetical protein